MLWTNNDQKCNHRHKSDVLCAHCLANFFSPFSDHSFDQVEIHRFGACQHFKLLMNERHGSTILRFLMPTRQYDMVNLVTASFRFVQQFSICHCLDHFVIRQLVPNVFESTFQIIKNNLRKRLIAFIAFRVRNH